MIANINITIREAKRNGPRKLKSVPLLTAQNVYSVRLPTTTPVRNAASATIIPVAHAHRHRTQLIVNPNSATVSNN